MEEPSFLEDMENIQRAMCNIKGNFMYLIFDRKNSIEIIEWLRESYLKNNQVIDKLTIQNEKLLEKLQDTWFSSDVSYFHMEDCLEDSIDMMDHEKHEKLQVIDVLEDYSDDIQSLVMVEEELELPLENGYRVIP